jgi:hypothetical protein
MALANGMSRRDAVRSLGGLLGSALLAYLGIGCGPDTTAPVETDTDELSANAGHSADCRRAGRPCRRNTQCCSKICHQGKCKVPCKSLGQTCRHKDQCCSDRCRDGKCRPACKAKGKTCSKDRECCSKNCDNGRCVAKSYDASGTWTGTVATSTETLPIRFVITDEGGTLSGQMLFGEPGSGRFLSAGDLSGARDGLQAHWDLQDGGSVSGSFQQDRFTGALTFVPQEGAGAVVAQLRLQR